MGRMERTVPLVAIAPGAAYGGAKRWPPEYFAELVDGLAADGVQCVMVGTAADAETGADVERSAKASRSIVNLVGRTELDARGRPRELPRARHERLGRHAPGGRASASR